MGKNGVFLLFDEMRVNHRPINREYMTNDITTCFVFLLEKSLFELFELPTGINRCKYAKIF